MSWLKEKLEFVLILIGLLSASVGGGMYAAETRVRANDNKEMIMMVKQECEDDLTEHLQFHIRNDKMVMDKLDKLLEQNSKLIVEVEHLKQRKK